MPCVWAFANHTFSQQSFCIHGVQHCFCNNHVALIVFAICAFQLPPLWADLKDEKGAMNGWHLNWFAAMLRDTPISCANSTHVVRISVRRTMQMQFIGRLLFEWTILNVFASPQAHMQQALAEALKFIQWGSISGWWGLYILSRALRI